ncbi:helix-turn-helix domain-containing protein [Saccharopolyspora sp. NPDC049426]|uniref:sigma-54-dependent Fis family transcriptional regulator n=1 Tax=Saccharopolyspora sp. NPDC049426 TaxID=3155652 RepID=UPI00341C4B7A
MPDNAEFDRIEKAKELVLSAQAVPVAGQSTQLVESWRRSRSALGGPENVADVPRVSEEVLDAHLLDLFRDPLTRFAEGVSGTGLGVLLADSRGRILHRWCGDRAASAHLDRIGTVRGAVLAEDTVGTNGVGTVVASGRGVQIQGVEHFADIYRNAICTGAPVRHPMTGNLLAVVTLSCDVTPRADLLRPLLSTVTQQLEQHVMEMQEPAARRAFNTFLEITRARPEPVVAFGPAGLLIQNPQAGRLAGDDLRQLHRLCAEGIGTGKYSVELSSGLAHVHVTAVDSGNRVAVVQEQQAGQPLTRSTKRSDGVLRQLVGRAPDWLAAHRAVERHRSSSEPLIIAGESGSGKLSLALGHPSEAGTPLRREVVDAAQRHVMGGRRWLQDLAARLENAGDVLIRGVQTLEPRILDGMRTVLRESPHRRSVLVTLTADAREDADAFGLKYDVPVVWVPPLRDRASDLPALWRHFAPSSAVAPDREALELLAGYQWPGNVKELRTIVGQIMDAGKSGAVVPGDLPAAVRNTPSLTMIERVELEAIRRALREAEGNRAKAAQILGLSRATVYRKMKAYRLIS